MKKLLALLLMALLLIPALAMAEIPETLSADTIKNGTLLTESQRGLGNSRLVLKGNDGANTYEAHYTFGGGLWWYSYTYECGCTTSYTSSGETFGHTPVTRAVTGKPSAMWDDDFNCWILEGQPYTFADNHVFSADTHKVPVANEKIEAKMPASTAMEAIGYEGSFAELKNTALGLFKSTLNDEKTQGGTVLSNVYTNSSYDDDVLVRKQDAQLGVVFGSYLDGNLYEVYIGALAINSKNRGCRLVGDSRYGTFTTGNYDWETGDLKEIFIQNQNETLKVVYTSNNVLQSYEAWDKSHAYWGFFDNQWEYSAKGDPDNTVKGRVPPDEVLESIVRIQGETKYFSVCTDDPSKLTAEQKSVPFIIASSSAVGGATPSVTAEQNDSHSMNYDISLTVGEKKVQPNQPVTLSLPLPNGVSMDVAKTKEFTVAHTNADGSVDVMSTSADSVTLTDDGLLLVTADSFSPYEVTWGTVNELKQKYPSASFEKPAIPAPNLPQTGDNSSLALYAVLLTLSVGALAVLLVAGKRRTNR